MRRCDQSADALAECLPQHLQALFFIGSTVIRAGKDMAVNICDVFHNFRPCSLRLYDITHNMS